jgi:beta-N-acetylhexosaminidase
MTAFAGHRLDADLLARIHRGEVGGLIVFGANYGSNGQLRAAIATAQAAARASGQPPLLIATDQEGGPVRRLPAPPAQPAASLARRGASGVQSQAGLAARALSTVGINVDLAPVADVPASANSFLGSRAFSPDRFQVARLTRAFVTGLQGGRVAATAKHFPGLGTAPGDTDTATITITSARPELARRLLPFRVAVDAGTKLVMVSSAIYPAYDQAAPAALSPAIVTGLLRRQLGFRGVVITDSLESPAIVASATPATRALKAGVDMLLYTSEADGKYTFARLLQEAQHDPVLRQRLAASHRRLTALKHWLATK